MKKAFYDYLISINTHKKLVKDKHTLRTSDREEKYKLIFGVPIMLPINIKADWHRELIEIILWEYPEEIEKIYKEIPKATDYSEIYIKHICRILKDKSGIMQAIENYSNTDTNRWIISNTNCSVSLNQKLKFLKYAKRSNGKTRTETKINGKGIFAVYPHFGKAVNINNPKTIVELGTGAGGGTAAVVLNMANETLLFTVDIGFDCLGNALGIAKYQNKNIIPICANFWQLPFASNSIDSVCTYNGLDESRENEMTVAEVSRILKSGGVFTVVSRKNAFMRQGKILEPFGFTQNEITELMKKCRVYSSIKTLEEICKKHGLILQFCQEFDRENNLIFVLSQFIKQ